MDVSNMNWYAMFYNINGEARIGKITTMWNPKCVNILLDGANGVIASVPLKQEGMDSYCFTYL